MPDTKAQISVSLHLAAGAAGVELTDVVRGREVLHLTYRLNR
jgi:hypothetical protein